MPDADTFYSEFYGRSTLREAPIYIYAVRYNGETIAEHFSPAAADRAIDRLVKACHTSELCFSVRKVELS